MQQFLYCTQWRAFAKDAQRLNFEFHDSVELLQVLEKGPAPRRLGGWPKAKTGEYSR